MDEYNIKFGIIGGSGFYHPNVDSVQKKVKTPFGKVVTNIIKTTDREIVFIARHGLKHSIPPHLINYKANIYAMHKLGVSRIISSNAVGSIKAEISIGSFVIPDQFIDFSIGRPKTFFDGKFGVILHTNEKRSGVVHIDLTIPYCPALRKKLIELTKKSKEKILDKGVYICTEGPRFETPAEINAFKTLGGTIVGMTSPSECILARELGMCYASVCLITNFAAGMQERITIEEVQELFNKKINILRSIILETISKINPSQESCKCYKT